MSPISLRRTAATVCTAAAVLAACAGAASAAPATIDVTEGAVDVSVPLDATFPSLIPRALSYETVDGTAAAGADYVAASSSALFAPLQTHRDLAVTIKADALHEADETFEVTGPGLLTQTVKILDDDPAPSVSVSDVTVHENDHTAQFDLSLSAPSGLPATVDWSTADGSAQAGADYAAASGQVTFAPGETRKSVSVDLVDDAANEPSETFALRLSHPVETTLADAEGVATVLDDDPAPASAPAPAPQDTRSQEQPPQGHVCCAVSIALPSRIRYAGLTKSGWARLKVTCSARIECAGGVTLTWHGLKLGSASALIHAHSTRIVKVRLSPRARRALARHHRLRVLAHLDDGSTRHLVITR